MIDSITKKGTIIYRAGSSAVRDDGERLAVSSQADRAGVVVWWRRCAWRRNAMASALPVSGSVEFKAAAIRAAVDVQRPITFADPALESRRQAQATKAQAKRRPGVSPVGQKPPPGCRNGLHTLGQLDQVRIEGEAQRPVQAPTQATPTPPAAKVQPPTRPAPSELEQREARLRAQMEAKKAKRQDKGNGCGR